MRTVWVSHVATCKLSDGSYLGLFMDEKGEAYETYVRDYEQIHNAEILLDECGRVIEVWGD